jgi:hypothetical protein
MRLLGIGHSVTADRSGGTCGTEFGQRIFRRFDYESIWSIALDDQFIPKKRLSAVGKSSQTF